MLRHRIFFGVAPLIILLMVVGGYAVWLFVRLGGAVNTTLHENYVSITAMRDLTDAALRIDRNLAAGSPQKDVLGSSIDEQAAICRRGVDAELKIITEPGEQEAAQRLQVRSQAFLSAVSAAKGQAAGERVSTQHPLDELLASAAEMPA